MLFLGPKAAALQKEEMDKLKDENVKLQSEIQRFNDIIEDLQDQVNNTGKENENLQEKVGYLQLENESLAKQSDELRIKNLNLQEKIRLLQTENESLKSKLESGAPNPIKWENEMLKCEVNGLRKLLAEKKPVEVATSTDMIEAEPTKKDVAPVQSEERLLTRLTPLTSMEKEPTQNPKQKQTFAFANELNFDDSVMDKLRQRYIAFDVETTGLSSYNDRIVEIGAVIFENQMPTGEFGTLVNPQVSISERVTAINHITNEMIKSAPNETKVYSELISFLGDALNGHTIICAHNAKFDIGFLTETLTRLGYNADISYVDTLAISRKSVYGIENYKQPTLAKYFGVFNEQEHRAASDAKVCGIILSKLLDIKREEQNAVKKRNDEFQKLRNEYLEKRKKVTINPTNNRVSLCDIRNLNDFDRGFDKGYKYWYEGDILRKNGDMEAAIQLFDKARYNGYNAPALYLSYAMAYRQLKDYDNEIDILDEAIERNGTCEKLEEFEERRYRAVCLLIKKQQKQQENIIKEQKNLEIKEKKKSPASAEPLKPKGKAILKLSDDMKIIKRYDTVTEASEDSGVSPKCIRDAAKGVQKHAGNFIWRYADDFIENI